MPSVASLVLGVLFSLWLGASVLNSTAPGSAILAKWEVSHLIPQWNFFAPNPGTEDYYILYRDKGVGGGVGAWQEVSDTGVDRNWTDAIWNPKGMEGKTRFDLVHGLVEMYTINLESGVDGSPSGDGIGDLEPVDSELIKLSMPYIALLNYVAEQPRSGLSEATQFLIMRKSGADGQIEPVFLSEFHDV